MPGSPVLVRYADDYVAMCYSREQAEEVKARLTAWLAPRGLSLNEDKTKVVHAEAGFNFLGFNVRRYVGRQGGKLLIKPSQESVKRLRDRLAAEVRSLHGSNAAAVVNRLNPIIRGWSAYYRSVVSSRLFAGLDHYVWHLTYRWARRMHPNKSKSWVVARYFGKFNMARQDRWVFGDRRPARTSPSSLGPRSSVTCPSGGGRHLTTRAWPSTGLTAAAGTNPCR